MNDRPHTSLVSLSLLLAAGCTSGGGPAAVTGALTSGHVSSEGGASGAVTVRAYALAPDGSTSAASDPVTTGADGRYALHVTLADSATALIVRVEDGTDRSVVLGRAAVDADVESGAPIVLAPIGARSTFAADVVAALEAEEEVSVEESGATSLFLSPAATARLSANVDRNAAVTDSVDGLSSARATFVEALRAEASGGASADAAVSAIAREEAHLAARLDAAATDADERAAYAAYLDAVIASATSAGFSADAVATASIAASSALDASLDGRLGGGYAALHPLAAAAITTAVDAGIGTSLDSRAIGDAGATLRAEVDAMAATAGSAEASAWSAYATTIASELSTRGHVDAALLATLDAEIDGATGTLDVTWTQIGASASASERLAALLTYRDSVLSSANVSLLVTAGLDETRARAALEAMAEVRAVPVVH